MSEPIIENIVISGGGINGFLFYGILKESEKQGIWNIKNIRSIWGTSVGAMLAVLISLGHTWETIDDYLINRPWDNLFKFDLQSFMTSNGNCGFFNSDFLYKLCKPLFLSKNIDVHVTMKEFYDITHIDVHVISTNVNSFELVDISHTTHPTWKLIDAIYASSSIPILFKPFINDSNLYCDGLFCSTYPIGECIASGISNDSIMGISTNINNSMLKLVESPSLFDYIIYIIIYIILKFIRQDKPTEINKAYKINSCPFTIQSLTNVLNSKDERISLIKQGCQLLSSEDCPTTDSTK